MASPSTVGQFNLWLLLTVYPLGGSLNIAVPFCCKGFKFTIPYAPVTTYPSATLTGSLRSNTVFPSTKEPGTFVSLMRSSGTQTEVPSTRVICDVFPAIVFSAAFFRLWATTKSTIRFQMKKRIKHENDTSFEVFHPPHLLIPVALCEFVHFQGHSHNRPWPGCWPRLSIRVVRSMKTWTKCFFLALHMLEVSSSESGTRLKLFRFRFGKFIASFFKLFPGHPFKSGTAVRRGVVGGFTTSEIVINAATLGHGGGRNRRP